MRARLALFLILAPLFTVFAAGPAYAATGIRISGGRLVEANGTELVLRGINHAHAWYQSQTSSFANIKATGANSVRVVLGSGQRWGPTPASEVSSVISLCKQNKLICVLEAHDTTGYGEQSGAATLAQAVDYWISVQSALTGQENYVILNIGNEPYGNSGYQTWTTDTANAIRRLRSAGFQHTIMVDAPNWGQDWTFTMRDNAPTVYAADTTGNTIFSIHMYGVFDTSAEVSAYLSSFVSRGLPIVVGEFGNNHSDGNPDEDAIMSYAQANRIGYLGWSWSGNGGGVEYLDMVTSFNPASRTAWGNRFIAGANGIAATSREATIYGGGTGTPDSQAPTTPGTPTASNLTSAGVNLTWSASTDNVGVAGYTVVRVQGTTETTVSSPSTNSAALTGLTASTAYTFAVYARDAAGNRSTRSGTVSVTTPAGGGGGNNGCAATYRIAGQWQGGFQGEVTVTNGSTASTGWAVSWTFANGQTITQMWNGQDTPSGASHSVRNVGYNGNLAPNSSAQFGFTGTWNGTNSVPTLTCARS
jgi:mannan endo-1,4-beta-mannosidase